MLLLWSTWTFLIIVVGFCAIENNMPNVVKALVTVSHSNSHPGGILSSIITSVNRLYLCLPYSKVISS